MSFSGGSVEARRKPEFVRLRHQAEGHLRLKALAPIPTTHEDIHHLYHEIQIHQIELELQNEELVNARKESDEELEKFTNLYYNSPIGYIILDRNGIINMINISAAALLGGNKSKLTGLPFRFFIHGDISYFEKFIKKVIE